MITAADHDKINPHIEIITVVALSAKRARLTCRPIINEKGYIKFGLEANALQNKQRRPTIENGRYKYISRSLIEYAGSLPAAAIFNLRQSSNAPAVDTIIWDREK